MGKPESEVLVDLWDSDEWLADDLFEDETILWAARPRSPRSAVIGAVPTAHIGLLILATGLFLVIRILWIGSFVPEDKSPLALHTRILVAGCVGLWVIPSAMFALACPLFAWKRMAHTYYTLTNMRAIVVEPDFLGRPRTYFFWPSHLRRMEWLDRVDRTSDFVFRSGEPPNPFTRHYGLLGVDQPHVVAALIWRIVDEMTVPPA